MHIRATLAAAATLASVAVACQAPPPPAPPAHPAPPTNPTAPPSTAPTPVAPISCGATATDTAAADFTPEPLSDEEVGVAAFSAAVDANATAGLVEITTVRDGRPEFDVVPVPVLGVALSVEEDPVLAVDEAETVTATDAGDPLHADQWSDTVTPYSPAWTCGRGAGVDIAIVDTGVDATHPDLSGHTTLGGSSLDGAASVTPGTGGVDPHGHGTHVAGIAAATAGNGIGIAGVAPQSTIIPVRVLGATGSGWSADVAAGIVWAVDDGAEVVNLSLGSTGASLSIANAVAYADAAGVVVVAAGGNDGPSGAPHYPAAGDHTVAVASITSAGTVSGFSTHGSYLDVAAPGSSIISTLPGGGYGYKSGTSMATPFVSGVVALMLGARPTMTPAEVTATLVGTADDAGAPGYDVAYGHGIVDPVAALGSG